MGGSVSVVSPCTPAHNEFKALYNDKKAMHSLFMEIASFDHDETEGKLHWKEVTVSHLDIKDKICLSEILLFISREANPIFAKNVTKNVIAIKEAFKFAIGAKASKNYANHEMVKKEFRKLVPALLLFTELYNIFAAADTNIDDDRIFPAEYARARLSIAGIDGVSITPVTEEEWESEFKKIDTNHNGYISFSEFTKYALAKIITPTFYINEITLKADQEQEVIDTVGSQIVQATLLQTMNRVSQQSMRNLEASGPVAPPPTTTLHEEGTPETIEVEVKTKVKQEENVVASNERNDSTEDVVKLVRQASSDFITQALSTSVKSKASADAEFIRQAESKMTRQLSSECVTMAISQSLSALGNS